MPEPEVRRPIIVITCDVQLNGSALSQFVTNPAFGLTAKAD